MTQIVPKTDSLILSTALWSVVFYGIYTFFKHALKRRKFQKLIPSTSHYFLDFVGDLSTFPRKAKYFLKYPITHYMIQYVFAYQLLFQKFPVFCGWLGFIPLVGINDPDAVEEVLTKTHTNEKSWFYQWFHKWIGTGLLTSHGQKWKARRKLLSPAFNYDVLKDFLPVMNEKSMQLVQKWKKEVDKEFIDVNTPLTMCSLDIICGTTLGVDMKVQDEDESKYLTAVDHFLEKFTRRFLRPWRWLDSTFYLTMSGRKQKRDLELMHDFTMTMIETRKKTIKKEDLGKDDKYKKRCLMEVLLEHHMKSDNFNVKDVCEEVDTFAFEGHDTVSVGLIWTVHHIGLNKHVQDKLHKELDEVFGDDTTRPITHDDLRACEYLECVVKESLRISPPVPIIARKANKDLNIKGYPMPEGASLVVCPLTLHREEKVFPNPEVFDPERFTPENSANRHPFMYIPFSAGPRNCIGQRFAMLELKTVVGNILRNFNVESLDPRCKVLPCFEIILKPSGPVRIKLTPRIPATDKSA